MSIKIPVQAELNQTDIAQQIKQLEAAFNDLGRVAQEAGRIDFKPISKTSLEDARRMKQEFDAIVRMAPGLKRALETGGQGGKSFGSIDWDKVWTDPKQRAGHAETMVRRLGPAGAAVPIPPPGSGGRGGRGGGGNPEEDRTPGTGGSAWRRAAGGAAAGLAGGVASQVGGLAGGISSGAIAGGLAGGPIGAAVGGIVGSLTSLLGALGDARDIAISLDTLKRTLGDTNVNYQELQGHTRNLADEFSLSDTEATGLTSRYAKLAGGSDKDLGALRNEVGVGVGFSRSFGLDPSAGVDFFGQMKGLGITKSADDNKRLALMIGESVAKAGELPRMADVMSGLSRYMEGTAERTLGSGNGEAWLAKMVGLSQSGLPGTTPANNANMIAKADNAVSQGGITEAGKNFMNRTLQSRLGLNTVQADMQLEGGLFATGQSTFGPESAIGAYNAKNGIQPPTAATSSKTNMELLLKDLEEQYRGKPRELMLNAMKTQFGLSYAQASAFQSTGSANIGGLVQRLGRLGVDPSKVNATGISKLSQIEANGSLSETEKDAMAKDAASKNQDDTDGSLARTASINGANAMIRLAEEGLPMISSIQSGVLKLAGMDAPGTPEQRARETEHQQRLGGIESSLGTKKDAAWKAYSEKVPFWKRGATALQNEDEEALGNEYWAAKKEYDDAISAESQQHKKNTLDNVPAGAPELHRVLRDQDIALPTNTRATSSGSPGVSGATPGLLARAAESDRKAGLPEGTTAGLMAQESSFNSNATSSKGARGLFQIMPANTAVFSGRVGRQLDPTNTDDAFYMYDELMKERKAKYGSNTDKMLKSYHGGYDEDAWGPINADYVPAIERRKREIESSRAADPIRVEVHQSGEFTLRDTAGNAIAEPQISTVVGTPKVSGVR
ncbi:lytic transglycosylase domain-containing protein [Pseudomonas fluorescens]|uniref:lytic transglycosylase domain-containing protein n=1 Tax=Pseudomonas fluorescens TaxID=294 RepID=UPI001676BDD2|nr:lytic transglycosylase domain-containing protein [Pseudomonas fluorescens]